MVDWVPIKHQLDILRMDVQYTLREIIRKTDANKAYRSSGDLLITVLYEHGLLDLLVDDGKVSLVRVSKFGRRLVDNDHAMREVAMAWMDFLPIEDIEILQNDISQWQFRDPAVRTFIQENNSLANPPSHDDFFPQSPWYYHTVGPKKVPSKLRDKEAEQQYVQGGYTGRENSAAEMIDAKD